MNEFLLPLVTSPLFLYALIAGFLASFVGGVIGSYVVVKRISFISGSISHSIFAGIGIFLWLERVKGISWISPLEGAFLAGILSALIIGWIHLHYRQREDSVIAAVWSIGMALGILFVSQTPGYNVELTNYLVGNILWVTKQDLYFLLILDVLVISLVIILHPRLLAICFDEEQATLQGIKVHRLYLLLLTLISITVVLLMQIVGIILVMTMLTIPATIANLYTKQLSRMMAISVALSCLFCLIGMVLSFYFDFPTGASIAMTAGTFYVFSLFTKKQET